MIIRYMRTCAGVRACVRACVRVCVCVCDAHVYMNACVLVWARMRVCLRAGMRARVCAHICM